MEDKVKNLDQEQLQDVAGGLADEYADAELKLAKAKTGKTDAKMVKWGTDDKKKSGR